MQGEGDEAEKIPSVSDRIKQMESKKIRFSAMRDKAAKRRYISGPIIICIISVTTRRHFLRDYLLISYELANDTI